jgi:hypothetical protein
VQRCYERHRMEEQLWSLAYQQVWPVIRKKPRASGAQTNQRRFERSGAISKIVRRA